MTNCAWSVAAANTSSLQAHQRLSTANHIPIDQSGHFSLSSLASDTTARAAAAAAARAQAASAAAAARVAARRRRPPPRLRHHTRDPRLRHPRRARAARTTVNCNGRGAWSKLAPLLPPSRCQLLWASRLTTLQSLPRRASRRRPGLGSGATSLLANTMPRVCWVGQRNHGMKCLAHSLKWARASIS
jgi:hypothetical protein